MINIESILTYCHLLPEYSDKQINFYGSVSLKGLFAACQYSSAWKNSAFSSQCCGRAANSDRFSNRVMCWASSSARILNNSFCRGSLT